MAELFRNKARSEGLIIYFDEEKGVFSDTFKLWCVKLKDLTIENFRDGTLAMEQQAEAMYKTGEQMWPPSFAEFRALCFPSVDYDKQAHRMLPSLWDPVAMCYRLEDQTAKAERYKIGMQHTAALLQDLGDTKNRLTPAQADEAQEFARIRLEQAKQLLAKKQGA